MIEIAGKEVRFDRFCKYCDNFFIAETDDPCNECLSEPMNEHSTVPVKFKSKKVKVKDILQAIDNGNRINGRGT